MKRKNYQFGALALYLVLAFSITNCGRLPEEKVKAFKKEMGEREIRRVLESDIVTEANKIGEEIRFKIDSITEGNLEITEKIKGLEETYNAKIELIKNDTKYSEEVSQIMDAYLFSSENNKEIESNVQKLENEDLFYSSPILTDSAGIKKLIGVWGITIKKAEAVRSLTAEDSGKSSY